MGIEMGVWSNCDITDRIERNRRNGGAEQEQRKRGVEIEDSLRV